MTKKKTADKRRQEIITEKRTFGEGGTRFDIGRAHVLNCQTARGRATGQGRGPGVGI